VRNYSEDALVEQPAIALFGRLGYETINAFREKPGKGSVLGRETWHEVVLVPRVRAALRKLNPGVAREAIELAIADVTADRSALSPVHANREMYRLLKDGVKVKMRVEGGVGGDAELDETVRIIDWNTPIDNDFLLVSQFKVAGEMHNRRADLVAFVNGLPLVLVELKTTHKRLENAYQDNLRDYKD